MSGVGQILQEAPQYTNIESVHFDWVDAWTQTTTPTTVILPEPVGPVTRLILQRFESAFSYRFDRILRFAFLTQADTLFGELACSSPAPTGTGTWTEAQVWPTVPESPAEALGPIAIVDRLIAWLEVTYEELAAITGISRSALFYWRKTGATPRSTNMRHLMRVYSVVSLLVNRFGVDGARRWFHSDGSESWQNLLSGSVDTVERRARATLFRQPVRTGSVGHSISDDVDIPLPTDRGSRLERAKRSPKRGRLASGD